MTTPAQNTHPEGAAQNVTTRRRRRTMAVSAVAVGALVGGVAVVDADSATDDDTTEIAFGSTWS